MGRKLTRFVGEEEEEASVEGVESKDLKEEWRLAVGSSSTKHRTLEGLEALVLWDLSVWSSRSTKLDPRVGGRNRWGLATTWAVMMMICILVVVGRSENRFVES